MTCIVEGLYGELNNGLIVRLFGRQYSLDK